MSLRVVAMKRLLARSLLSLPVLLILAVLAGTRPARGQGTQAPAPDLTMTEVLVTGNRNADASLIRSVTRLKPGNKLTRNDVAESIRQLYRLGMFSDVRVLAARQDQGLVVTIAVKEYPLLDHVEITGNKRIGTKDLEREVTIFQGQAVSPYRRKMNRDKLLKLYKEKGYLLASITDQVEVSGNNATLKLAIDEGKKVKLGDIVIEGNQTLPDDKIKKALKKKGKDEKEVFWKTGDLRRERIQEALDKVITLYKKNGFRDAKVLADSIWFSESKEKMFWKIAVSEGRQWWLGTVTFEGNSFFTAEQLARQFTLKSGDVLNEEKYNESINKLFELYGEQGYLYATPYAKEQPQGDTLNVAVIITEGEPARVHRINIAGNTKTKDKVIRREIVLKPGQVFKRSALLRSQREIFQLNYFQDVLPDINPTPNGDVDIGFQVQEKPTGTANAGAGYSGLDGLVGTIGIVIPNFMGNGQTINFGWEFGSRRNSIQVGFIEPWLFDSPTSAGLDLFRTVRYWFGEFRIKETGFGLQTGRRLKWPDSYFRLTSGYRLANLTYTGFSAAYYPGNPETRPELVRQRLDLEATGGLTSSVSMSLYRDSRDFPQFATAGSRHGVSVTLAGLGGDVEFLRQVYTSEVYVPSFSGTSISFRSKYALINNPLSRRQAPFNERFFPGGISFDGVIRGYGNNSIGPYISINDSTGALIGSSRIGGSSMLILTAEYQIPIVSQRKSTSPLYAIAFAEAGNAWDRVGQTTLNPKVLKKAVGVGFRAVMPLVGVFGFDFGYGFDPPSDPYLRATSRRSGWNTHFQLGQIF
ncbi:MAG: outer membrane protein assembly factor BamA [Candidatus Latescibacteria bacterium]|nr:outer membrane protein assembly factor BamA [Candidatus Latescibacterota bacterium]